MVKSITIAIVAIIGSVSTALAGSAAETSSYLFKLNSAVISYMSSTVVHIDDPKPFQFLAPVASGFPASKSCDSSGICSFSFNPNVSIKTTSSILSEEFSNPTSTTLNYCGHLNKVSKVEVAEIKNKGMPIGFKFYSDSTCASELSTINFSETSVFIGKSFNTANLLHPYIPFSSENIEIKRGINSNIPTDLTTIYPNITTDRSAVISIYNHNSFKLNLSDLSIIENGVSNSTIVTDFEGLHSDSAFFTVFSGASEIPPFSHLDIFIYYTGSEAKLNSAAIEIGVTGQFMAKDYAYLSLIGGKTSSIFSKFKEKSSNYSIPAPADSAASHWFNSKVAGIGGIPIKKDISIVNRGSAEMSLSNISGEFISVISSSCVNIAKDESCDISLEITPPSNTGMYPTDLLLSDSYGKIHTIPLVITSVSAVPEALSDKHSFFKSSSWAIYKAGYSGNSYSVFGDGIVDATYSSLTSANLLMQSNPDKIWAGRDMSFLYLNNQLYGSGDNSSGALSISGGSSSYWAPVSSAALNAEVRNVAISKGVAKSSAIVLGSGQVLVSGTCASGIFGNSCTSSFNYFSQTASPSDEFIVKAIMGDRFMCVISLTHNLYCRGNNASKQIVNSASSFVDSWVLSAENVKDAVALHDSIAILSFEGKAYCRGGNSVGECGMQDSPVGSNIVDSFKEINLNFPVVSIKSDSYSIWLLDSKNQLVATGPNISGKFGNNYQENSAKVTALTPIGEVLDFFVGENYSIVINTDGILYGAGENAQGQLGIGSVSNSNSYYPLNF